MRHKVDKKRFSRRKSHREAMLKNLACSLILNEKVKTTETKAKEVRRLVEKLIRKSQEGDKLNIYRYLLERLPQKKAAQKLINEINKRYTDLKSGFVTIYKLGQRKGDGAQMVLIELRQTSKDENKNKEGEKESVKDSQKKNSLKTKK